MARSPEVTQYSADGMVLTWGGIDISAGFADGDDVISAENRVDAVDLTVGIKGDGTFSVTRDRSGTVKVKYLQNCSAAKFLSAKLAAMRAGAIIALPLILTEIGGDSGFTGNKAMLKKNANLKRGGKANATEFEFLVADLNITHGEGVSV